MVARRAPVGVFSPGHDKWDYPYSLGHRRPALVVELADVSAADAEYLASLGYEVLPSGLYVQRDAPGVRRDALAVDLGTDAALTYALGLARGTTVAEVRP